MDNQKQKVIIVFSPIEGDISGLAEKIAQKYKEARCAVSVKPAGEVTVPEINAADLLIFGAEEEGSTLREGGFKEIMRAFTGINFAGKTGALFSYSMNAAIDGLKDMIKDTDLNIVAADLVYMQNGKLLKDKKIDKWINQTCTAKA